MSNHDKGPNPCTTPTATSSVDLLPLETKNLTLRLNDRTLIDRVSFACESRHTTVILGANGAGKSLLLRLLHGLIAPTSGTIHWAGTPHSDRIRNRQAMVFQKPVLLRRTAAANIDFAMKLRGGIDISERNALLKRVGLTDHATHPARQLSGGEQQRLTLARALATKPDILFLDEPTANLDPTSLALIEHVVKDVSAAGVKTFFVTHDRSQAARLADEVLFLYQGRLIEHTPAATFFDTPQTPEARAYLDGHILL